MPDLPAAIRGAWVITARAPRHEALDRIYHRPPWREVHLAAHAAWGPLVLLAANRGPRARALAAGWAGHLAVDYVTHHDDAWPPAWPLSPRRWRAPVSYWQREHHAVALLAADIVGSIGLPGRRVTPLALLAGGVTLHALRRAAGPDHDSPLGLVADAGARDRDLGAGPAAATMWRDRR